LPILSASLFTDQTFAACPFKSVLEGDKQLVTALAQPLYFNGQIEFRISRSPSGVELELRFRPSANFKPRFSASEVIQHLNDVQAGVRLTQLREEESVHRIKDWASTERGFVAIFQMSEAFYLKMGSGFFDFGLDLPQALKDIHPSGYVDTSDCGTLLANLRLTPQQQALSPASNATRFSYSFSVCGT